MLNLVYILEQGLGLNVRTLNLSRARTVSAGARMCLVGAMPKLLWDRRTARVWASPSFIS